MHSSTLLWVVPVLAKEGVMSVSYSIPGTPIHWTLGPLSVAVGLLLIDRFRWK